MEKSIYDNWFSVQNRGDSIFFDHSGRRVFTRLETINLVVHLLGALEFSPEDALVYYRRWRADNKE